MKEDLYLLASILVQDIRDPLRIDTYLCQRYPETGRTQFQKQIANKWILVNNHEIDKGSKVHPNDHILIFTPYKSKIEWLPNPGIIPVIVFEDEQIIVINKPSGLQVHPASGNHDNTLINALVAYLGNTDIHIVHRLDKFTSGLIVFAKTETARDLLSEAFSKKIARRKYQALVWGKMEAEGTINEAIGRLPENRQRFGPLSKFDGGKSAITHYTSIKSFPFHSFIECRLETGRTHQIRVHMQYNKTPIVGDQEYGGDQILIGIREEKYIKNMEKLLSLFNGQALHAMELEFPHPETNEKMKFTADLPVYFNEALELLEIVSEDLGGRLR
jgi:23S rRNA pseudouridine1911/1915/1917 synthase